jgi:hypothetical protein
VPDYDGDAVGEVVRQSAARYRAHTRDEEALLKPRWFNSLGQEVDLDDIDREYAIRILAHLARYGIRGSEDLVRKLVDVAVNGRAPNERDLARARAYNDKNEAAGLPWRAPR